MFILLILIIIAVYFFLDRYQESNHKIPDNISYNHSARLTTHFYSSPHGVNWKSPRSSLISVVLNTISPLNRSISHVAIELQSSDNSVYRFTSMTDTGKDAVKKLLIDQIGMGVLFAVYPGKLENAGMLQAETQAKRKQGRVQSVTYLINDELVKKIHRYLNEYVENGNDKLYSGLDKEPRYNEGSGCVHFARSVFEIAQLENLEFLKGWNTHLKIPRSLVGNNEKKVSIFKLLFSKECKVWPSDEDTLKEINFWDIDRIFEQIKSIGKISTLKNNASLLHPELLKNMEVRKHLKSYELIFDMKEHKSNLETFWLKRKNTIK